MIAAAPSGRDSPARRTERRVAAATIVLPALGTLAALLAVPLIGLHPLDLALCATFYGLGVLGVTTGYHRLAAHRSFDAPPACAPCSWPSAP